MKFGIGGISLKIVINRLFGKYRLSTFCQIGKLSSRRPPQTIKLPVHEHSSGNIYYLFRETATQKAANSL
jgi:hypothetical protein